MSEAVNQGGAEPDVIFVTGGTAKSPVINDFIKSKFGNKPVVVGDHFGSVTAGLSRWAETIFK
ncbi:molecular chaperone, partial [Psychrosphaera haliotis]|nr:molecular chaperone [Psychrosphaera haliotis]